MIWTWLFNLKNTWTSQSSLQNISQFYCQTIGVWVSQSWLCQEINFCTTVYSALPTLQHPSISELLNNSPRLLPPRPTCIQKGKYQRSCLSLLSTMNLFSNAVYSTVMTYITIDLLTSRAFERVARLWARSASERKFVPGPTTPDQKTKRTTLRKSNITTSVQSTGKKLNLA